MRKPALYIANILHMVCLIILKSPLLENLSHYTCLYNTMINC